MKKYHNLMKWLKYFLDDPPELPSRPPLPVEMRHLIVEDIAQNRTPNTQSDILTAERNLELRMQQPAYFDYPTPRQPVVNDLFLKLYMYL